MWTPILSMPELLRKVAPFAGSIRSRDFFRKLTGILIWVMTLAVLADTSAVAGNVDDADRDANSNFFETIPARSEISERQRAFFESRIRPVLAKHCARCHFGPASQAKGGLQLDRRDHLRKGGVSGEVIVPGKPEESRLIRALKHDGLKMPPTGRLDEKVIADFEAWIRDGAPDPRDDTSEDSTSATDAAKTHWAYQPLARVSLPDLKNKADSQHPIDRFLQAEMDRAGVAPMPHAERKTLLRRLTFDLVGLPPTPEQQAAFLADDSPESWNRIVNQLLDSPEYGVRWGRMWLDVVRYADTAGETADLPAPHAWRYRNYVVDSFNANKPFDQFLKEQLAGDLLARSAPSEKYAELNTATGYLAIARRFGFDATKDHYLTIEDTIDTLGKSVLGLTIACARCHDHKYDPISSADYYGLYGIFESSKYSFSGCEKDRKPRDLIPLEHPALLEKREAPLRKQLAGFDEKLSQINQQLADLNRQRIEQSKDKLRELAAGQIDDGGVEEIGTNPLVVDVQRGEAIFLKIDRRENYGADTTLIEFQVEELDVAQPRVWNLTADALVGFLDANPHADRLGNRHVWAFFDLRGDTDLLGDAVRGLSNNKQLAAWRKGDNPAVFVNDSTEVASVWTKLPPRSLFVHPAQDGPVGIGWISPISGKVRVTGKVQDGHPGGSDGVSWTVSHLQADIGTIIARIATLASERGPLSVQRGQLQRQLGQVALGYGVVEGTPANTRIQKRGEPADLGEEVPRKFLDILGGAKLPSSETGSGRLQLAEWLTDRKNPLTARVFVNRIWQQHMGKGLVATPNDFGSRGVPPTHPALLDWLAQTFIDSGWNVKELHRLIVTSAAFQRRADGFGELLGRGDAVDPENRLYWRFERRRLAAEEIRDAILMASGQLDLTPGGSHPFPPEESWGFTQHGPFQADYETNRRSIYLMIQRIKRHPFLGLFDGADPSTSTPVRPVSTVATQALYFLNSPFVHQQAEFLARRLEAHSDVDSVRIRFACELLYARPSEVSDLADFASFVDEQCKPNDTSAGKAPLSPERRLELWTAWCRVLLSSNEFLYVD